MTGATLEGRYGESEEPAMDPNDLRIGDAEREQTMADLREHFAQGRLDREELDQRLDRTLGARTARDLAQITADLPGQRRQYDYRDPHGLPPQAFDKDAWRAAMKAHRHQMQSMRHERRDMRHGWGRRHHGPGPFLPILFVLLMVGLVFGGFGIAKVLFFVFIGAMVFKMIHRHSHRR
ncbi:MULTISPECIES: DUF1707 domain-containing protein [unclassified Nonomuraea]|uniref:DUF1707 SHOCT-like domain-containing protein n=1 Tax=unclassified Nonomuraea TaxID=2593643 RepID=UPI0033C704C8